ncbi:ABC transporter ATP-binding protein [Cohnella nanjingensis]|uniref:ABC transporter ATP-binding protein n=1 Tax=Cohnella nanjingensis TaxID=1387779 RepID=A0A7X0RZ04_9BACL|nr:dipeptide/oligopeptide/nickel ABC transporter ATP-binding protein [Cohnella nanjingensis]MBB6674674.1 ABC transporter ATP-binding protein [Cohnella nanjingensis]
MSLLVAERLSKTYHASGWFRRQTAEGSAISNLSFTLEEGTCLGILGESGAGKSTLGRMVLGLLPPDEGRLTFRGEDLYPKGRRTRRSWRRDIQVVFQDSYSAVNPRMTIRQIISEPLRNYERQSAQEERRTVAELLELVGLAADDMLKRPSQMSGGQLQRVNIARAIALKPKLIVLDEPVSSLDMIVQKQILHHLRALKEKYGLSYLLISHDVMAVHYLADRVALLEKGTLVDTVDASEMFESGHPTFRAMMQAAGVE